MKANSEMRNEVIISDLKCFKPENAISYEIDPFKWRAVDYETEAFNGTMFLAMGESQVPELTYDPELKGWYAVYIGIVQLTFPMEGVRPLTGFRLSGDKYPVYYDYGPSGYWFGEGPFIYEALWKYEDMTGKSIEIMHPENARPAASNAAYFRFVPISESEAGQIRKDRLQSKTKRILAHHDIHSAFYYKKPKSAGDLAEELEPFRNSDVDTLLLEYIVDVNNPEMRNYFPGSLDPVLFPREGDRYVEEGKKKFISRNVDFYSEMIRYAHSMGIKVALSLRMNAFTASCPWDALFTSYFYKKNPHLRCRDINGDEISRLSYAFKEVQDMTIKIFKSMLEKGADGVHMLFNRGLPCILCEEPVVSEFVRTTGKNPFDLDEEDKEWIKFRSRYFTENFMKRVRRELDDYASVLEKSKRPLISAHALGDERTNMFFGLDIAAWAKEGIVDAVVGYPIKMQSPDYVCADRPTDIDMGYYAEISKNTPAKTYVDMLPRRMEPEKYVAGAMDIYKAGIDGICMWDSNSRVTDPGIWAVASRLGHADELETISNNLGKYYKKLPVKSLGGVKVDKYPPFWGF